MRDLSNLDWPEAPFGADQRPFGKRQPMLAAFALDWCLPDDRSSRGSTVSAAATVYLRVSRVKSVPVPSRQLSFGYRCFVRDPVEDDPLELCERLDRALLRARRHAAAVVAEDFQTDLDRLADTWGRLMRGALGLQADWRARSVKGRGVASMIDLADGRPAAAAVCDRGHVLGQALIERALVVAVSGAAHLNLLNVDGAIDVHQLVLDAAWDQLSNPGASPS